MKQVGIYIYRDGKGEISTIPASRKGFKCMKGPQSKEDRANWGKWHDHKTFNEAIRHVKEKFAS